MSFFRKHDVHSSWPTTLAKIDEYGQSGLDVEGSGAYAVEGEYYSVQFVRKFNSLREAADFVEKLETNPNLSVRYNPKKPMENEIVWE